MSFAVYRSSAGSGKTFTLVLEYLKIILKDPRDFRHILAITFTNLAAGEMKERVLQALQKLSSLNLTPDPGIREGLLPVLISETGLQEHELIDRAGKALTLIMHHYDDFAVGTIDGFSHRILRSFAHDFGLSMQFNVELDTEMLIDTAIGLLLDKVGVDSRLTRLLVRFLESRLEEDKGYTIDRTLADFSKNLLDEEGQISLRDLERVTLSDFSEVAKWLSIRRKEFEQSVLEIGSAAMSILNQSGIHPSALLQGRRGIYAYFGYLASGRFDKVIPNKTQTEAASRDSWAGKKATAAEIRIIGEIQPLLVECWEKAGRLYPDKVMEYELHRQLSATIFPLAVLHEIDRVMSEFKKQNNLIYIGEFNRRISDVVSREPVPFIYERLGERYHHIMIDEFQDTSRLQWQNFVPLIENALGSGYFNLVVGDGKQAIYRWRNGDVNQFTSLPRLAGSETDHIIRQRENSLTNHFEDKELNRNYRSKQTIVEFNNRFFTFLAERTGEPVLSVYRGVEQQSRDTGPGGYVRIQFQEPVGDAEEPSEESGPGNEQEVLNLVNRLREDGYGLNDIAVLCRTNRQASTIARVLITAGIGVVSPESLLLSQSPAVRFLAGFIRYLQEPEDLVGQAELAAFLFRSGRITMTGWPELFHCITSMTGGLSGLLTVQNFAFSREELLSLPLYDLCESLIRLFHLDRTADAYLQFFLDAVLSFIQEENPGKPGFSEWWEQKGSKRSVMVPAGMDAVRIMTIHQSKGLQFPVVILPFKVEKWKTTKDFLWVDLKGTGIPILDKAILNSGKALERTRFSEQYLAEEAMTRLDQINLLYVAMTRPEERLYVLLPRPSGKELAFKSVPVFFSGFLEETDLCKKSGNTFEIGTPGNKVAGPPAPGISTLQLQQFISEPWRNRIRIRSRAPEMWDMEDPDRKFSYGNQVHALMARIITADDTGAALREATGSGRIRMQDEPVIRAMILQVVGHPALSAFFQKGGTVKNEPEILLPDGNFYRPDRINLQGDHAIVLEYKTGKKEEFHQRQILKYGGILQEMGYIRVRMFLVYLHAEVEVIECT